MGSKAREFFSKIPVYLKLCAQYIDITSKSTKERSNTTAEKIDKKKPVRLPKPPIVAVIDMSPSQPFASPRLNIFLTRKKGMMSKKPLRRI